MQGTWRRSLPCRKMLPPLKQTKQPIRQPMLRPPSLPQVSKTPTAKLPVVSVQDLDLDPD